MLTADSAESAIKKGMKDAVTFGPFLIINGKSAQVKGNGGWGVANRTAIAQRKDGIVLFLVIDGRGADGSNGISILDMIKLFERYGAYNAANLDGGGSSTLVIEDKLINNPRGYGYSGARYLPNAWVLK
jgi:exopolysaccharide biosynthesis protein